MAAGVVGDFVAHHFDEQGRVLDIPANRRSISLDADSIRNIPKVIAVSGSVSKARAIAAALRGGSAIPGNRCKGSADGSRTGGGASECQELRSPG